MVFLLACTTANVWPDADAACADFSEDCRSILSAHFGLTDSLSGLTEVGLLEGLWELVGMELGEDCPAWSPDGGFGAACLYNSATEAVSRSEYSADVEYLDLSADVLKVGDGMGYYSPLRVPIALARGLAGGCGEQWVGEAGFASCEGDDCLIFLEARGAVCD